MKDNFLAFTILWDKFVDIHYSLNIIKVLMYTDNLYESTEYRETAFNAFYTLCLLNLCVLLKSDQKDSITLESYISKIPNNDAKEEIENLYNELKAFLQDDMLVVSKWRSKVYAHFDKKFLLNYEGESLNFYTIIRCYEKLHEFLLRVIEINKYEENFLKDYKEIINNKFKYKEE